jgi:MOSC domain-containing protein YiiM
VGRVEALCRSDQTGVQKTLVPRAVFKAGFGLEGDAHAGDWHRQVSLLSAEDVAQVQRRLPDVAFGAFAENVVVSGLDLASLGIGSRLRLGEGVELTITQIGKECHTPCRIYHLTGDCIMPRLGLFAVVDRGGAVAIGDSADILIAVPRKQQ